MQSVTLIHNVHTHVFFSGFAILIWIRTAVSTAIKKSPTLMAYRWCGKCLQVSFPVLHLLAQPRPLLLVGAFHGPLSRGPNVLCIIFIKNNFIAYFTYWHWHVRLIRAYSQFAIRIQRSAIAPNTIFHFPFPTIHLAKMHRKKCSALNAIVTNDKCALAKCCGTGTGTGNGIGQTATGTNCPSKFDCYKQQFHFYFDLHFHLQSL